MNWGKKKTFQTTNVSLKTWLLRFKKMKDSKEPKLGNAQRKWNKGRVHDEDDDRFYLSIPFEKEKYKDDAMMSNSDYRINESPVSYGGFKKTSNGSTMRDFIDEEARLNQHESRNSKTGLTESVRNVVLENKPKIMLKNEKRRRRSKQGGVVNAHSSRTRPRVECRIKAFENMKRRRLKMKEMNAFCISLDCNAIVKSSFDPETDFRESMMEMMIEKGVMQREKLEELLFCYLTLNCDEYHRLIVKVFQETYNQYVNL